jgi:hypothetical protein
VINSETYLASAAGYAIHACRALPISLRSNRKINRALRAAYRKFDRNRETRFSLRHDQLCPDNLIGQR